MCLYAPRSPCYHFDRAKSLNEDIIMPLPCSHFVSQYIQTLVHFSVTLLHFTYSIVCRQKNHISWFYYGPARNAKGEFITNTSFFCSWFFHIAGFYLSLSFSLFLRSYRFLHFQKISLQYIKFRTNSNHKTDLNVRFNRINIKYGEDKAYLNWTHIWRTSDGVKKNTQRHTECKCRCCVSVTAVYFILV